MKGEYEGLMGVMVGTAFILALLSFTGIGNFMYGGRIPDGDKVTINVTNYNLEKISALQGELDNSKAVLDQLKNVKEVVCKTPAVDILQVIGGGIGGVLITFYFIFVLYPSINKKLEEKAEKKVRAEMAAKKGRK